MTFGIIYIIIIIALVIKHLYKRYLKAKGHPLQLSEVFTGFLYAQMFGVSWLLRNESMEIMMYILSFILYLKVCHVVKGFYQLLS